MAKKRAISQVTSAFRSTQVKRKVYPETQKNLSYKDAQETDINPQEIHIESNFHLNDYWNH